jgi:hypothetical protein
MSLTLFALGALFSAALAPSEVAFASSAAQAAPSQAAPVADPFANRPQARIAFTRTIQNFQVKRENNDDILYLETLRDRWYRSEITCFGIADPRDAHGIVPVSHGASFEASSRVYLVSFSQERNECSVRSLIELTQDEAIALRLIRRKAPRTKAPAP